MHAIPAQRDREMGLAGADGPIEHEVLATVDEVERLELRAPPVGGHAQVRPVVSLDVLRVRESRGLEELGAFWIGNGVLDRFLEDESLFGEFLRTPVSEGGVESLVVEPPHIVVEVGA